MLWLSLWFVYVFPLRSFFLSPFFFRSPTSFAQRFELWTFDYFVNMWMKVMPITYGHSHLYTHRLIIICMHTPISSAHTDMIEKYGVFGVRRAKALGEIEIDQRHEITFTLSHTHIHTYFMVCTVYMCREMNELSFAHFRVKWPKIDFDIYISGKHSRAPTARLTPCTRNNNKNTNNNTQTHACAVIQRGARMHDGLSD